METETERVTTEQVSYDPAVGTQRAVHTTTAVGGDAVVAAKANDWIWYIVGVIEVLLALRFAFLALGAADAGFTSFLYSLTHPLIAPFVGIFSSPSADTGYIDSAAVLAMVIYALLGWGISALVDVIKRPRA